MLVHFSWQYFFPFFLIFSPLHFIEIFFGKILLYVGTVSCTLKLFLSFFLARFIVEFFAIFCDARTFFLHIFRSPSSAIPTLTTHSLSHWLTGLFHFSITYLTWPSYTTVRNVFNSMLCAEGFKQTWKLGENPPASVVAWWGESDWDIFSQLNGSDISAATTKLIRSRYGDSGIKFLKTKLKDCYALRCFLLVKTSPNCIWSLRPLYTETFEPVSGNLQQGK